MHIFRTPSIRNETLNHMRDPTRICLAFSGLQGVRSRVTIETRALTTANHPKGAKQGTLFWGPHNMDPAI